MKKMLLFIFLFLVVIPLIFYGIKSLFGNGNQIKINNEFYIEYVEQCYSIGLTNKKQRFVCDLKEAYWNADSLVVSDNKGKCFLLKFGITKYNDQMIEINCTQLDKVLKGGTVKGFPNDPK